jgi:S1-C subfamily serine protease
VEFVQEYLAGGARQQTRAYTDGVVISADGLVLVSGKVRFPQRGSGRLSGGSRPDLSNFRLHFADGRRHTAELVAFQDDVNLGLLRITDLAEGQQLPFVQFRSGYEPAVGDSLRTLTLYSEEYGRKPVFSGVGVNALLDTPQDAWSLSGVSQSLLGAPLWDSTGKVVGVVAELPVSPMAGRQTLPDLTGPVGLAYDRFAAWIDEVSSTAREVRSGDKADDAPAAWLGVMFQPLDPDVAAHMGISPGGGVIISRTVPGSPAEAAGLKALDVLVELDGERIAVADESDTPRFAARIRQLAPGTTVTFGREAAGGARDDVPVALVQAPKSELHAERRTNEAFELTVREITLDTILGQRLERDAKGVVVDGVTRAGWGGLAGLQPGLVIQRINEIEVTDLDSFDAALEQVTTDRPEKVLFFARFGRNTRFLVAEPDWDELDEK